VTRLGAMVVDLHAFRDHHRFSRRELEQVSKTADEMGADLIVTTEKDWARMSTRDRPVTGKWRVLYADISIEKGARRLEAAIRERCRSITKA
jgi:tetraacyldisaccharide-1-P 4'-kinase